MSRQQFILLLFVAIIFWTKSDDDRVLNAKIHRSITCPAIKCAPSKCPNDHITQYGCRTCECNPCKFGQPLFQYPCGQGQNKCASNGGLCKVSDCDNAYCCPNEHPGCCPPVNITGIFNCPRSNCSTDAACPIGQKCCAPCARCTNATLS